MDFKTSEDELENFVNDLEKQVNSQIDNKERINIDHPIFDAYNLTLLIDGKPVNTIKFGISDDSKFIIDLFIGDEDSVKRVINGKKFRIVYQYPKDFLAIDGKYDSSNPIHANGIVYDSSDISTVSIKFPIIGNRSWGIFSGKA